MKTFVWIWKTLWRLFRSAITLSACLVILFITYRGNQPMQIPQAPAGMTYFEFIADRIDAAKTIEPSRCGWGILLTLAVLGPIYSIAYTEIGIHPQGALAQRADPDADIPTYVAAANWSLVPGIWWGTVERLSWTFLATHRTRSCSFRAVAGAE